MGLGVLEAWLLWVLPGKPGQLGLPRLKGCKAAAAEVGRWEGLGCWLFQKAQALPFLGKGDVLPGGCRHQPWMGKGQVYPAFGKAAQPVKAPKQAGIQLSSAYFLGVSLCRPGLVLSTRTMEIKQVLAVLTELMKKQINPMISGLRTSQVSSHLLALQGSRPFPAGRARLSTRGPV